MKFKPKSKYVYALWHIYRKSKFEGEEKLIGIFDKRVDAETVIPKLKSKPGFKQFPNGFKIFRYKIGQIGWQEGFLSA